MGNLFRTWSNYWLGFPKCNIIVTGLDAVGKTTLRYKMFGEKNAVEETLPSVGVLIETVTLKDTEIKIWDMGGRDKRVKRLYKQYPETNCIVFVIDSNDLERYEDMNSMIDILNDELLSDVCVLFLMNKQDLPNAKSTSEIVEILELSKLKQNWFAQPCCAISGEGLYEGFDWVYNQMKNKK